MKTVASSSVVSALRRMGGSLVLTAGKKTQDTSRTYEVSVCTYYIESNEWYGNTQVEGKLKSWE